LEQTSAVSGANPGTEGEGIAVVEGGSWLEND
jgi:hypothetical protein